MAEATENKSRKIPIFLKEKPNGQDFPTYQCTIAFGEKLRASAHWESREIYRGLLNPETVVERNMVMRGKHTFT